LWGGDERQLRNKVQEPLSEVSDPHLFHADPDLGFLNECEFGSGCGSAIQGLISTVIKKKISVLINKK